MKDQYFVGPMTASGIFMPKYCPVRKGQNMAVTKNTKPVIMRIRQRSFTRPEDRGRNRPTPDHPDVLRDC